MHNSYIFRSIKPGLFFIIIFLFSFLFPADLIAQNIPPGSEPGTQASRFQDEMERERKALQKKKVKAPEIELEEEKEEKPPVEEGITFTLKDIKITGATIFKPEDFKSICEPYLNRSVNFKDLEVLAAKIKGKYKEKGYITTLVYVPEQQITEGVVEIRVAEGKLGEVKIEGSKWSPARLVEKFFHTKKNEILNIFRLQRDLLRINQNPDVEVKTVLSQGSDPQTTDVILQVKDKMPYHIGYSLDNQGTRLVGRYRDSFTFRSTNLTGGGDSLFVNTIMGKSSYGNFVSYTAPIDTYATSIGLDVTNFNTILGEEYKPLNITGNSQIYIPHISGEIYLSEDFQANIETGFEIKSIRKRSNGQATTNDQLRQPYVSYDFTKIDSFFGGGQTTFSPKIIFGTEHFMGASSRNHPTSSRQGTGGFYFKYEHTIRRIQKMPFLDTYLSLRSVFQDASYTLPSSEMLQLGGAYSVRGYPEGDYLADVGATLTAEWIFPMYFVPKQWTLPTAESPLYRQIEPLIFMDLGGGSIKKLAPGEKDRKFLMGLGGGIRVRFNRNLYLRFEWAERIGEKPTQGQGPSNFYMTFQCES